MRKGRPPAGPARSPGAASRSRREVRQDRPPRGAKAVAVKTQAKPGRPASSALPRVPVRRILDELARLYPDARTALTFETPFQLLVATVLSAQCTDRTVNRVTPELFRRWPRPEDYLGLDEATLGEAIRHCGLWRSKARNILATCRALCERHGGEVPRDLAALTALPGVGRKTANVVLANAFGVPALAVDTHVFRVAGRLGLARAATPEQAEAQLRRRIPRRLWAPAHHWLIWHGRLVCTARRPRCSACTLRPLCPTGRALPS
jgi:endonuclease-3